MRTWIGILSFLLVGSAVGAHLLARQTKQLVKKESKSAEASSDDTRGTSDSQQHIALLEAALAQTRERLERLESAKQASKDPVPANAAAVSGHADEPTPEQVEEEYKQRAESFDAEPREEGWAAPAEKKIASNALANLPQGARLERGSCRTSLCRYELAFADRGEQRLFGQNFVHSIDSEGILGYHFEQGERRSDGTFPLQLLVFRTGFPMPGIRQD